MNTVQTEMLAPLSLSGLFETIEQTADLSSIIKIVKQLEGIEAALKSANLFHKQAIKFAQLEASALLRVIALGGNRKLGKSYRRATAEWLAEMNETDRETYIQMCAEGLTIEQVYKREIWDPTRNEDAAQKIKDLREAMHKKLEQRGSVDLPEYQAKLVSACRGSGVDPAPYFDQFRHSLREAGAVGVGHGSGLYVMPETAPNNALLSAIMERCDSIYHDVLAVRKLLSLCNPAPTLTDMIEYAKNHGEVEISRVGDDGASYKWSRKLHATVFDWIVQHGAEVEEEFTIPQIRG